MLDEQHTDLYVNQKVTRNYFITVFLQKNSIIDFLLGPWLTQSEVLCHLRNIQELIPFPEVRLKSSSRLVGYCHDVYANIALAYFAVR